jgi:SAM-dependent methyltransferase
MPSYLGRHAELYDLFYEEKPYAVEAAFVDACLRRHASRPGRQLLELACGTGSHAFELERLGYEIVATDSSEDMLDRAREKAAERASAVDFRYGDMRALEMPERFDAAMCLFDSIGYVRSNQALRATLGGVHRHLREGGLFVLEFWHAAAMLVHFEPVRVRKWSRGENEVVRVSRTRLDVPNQLAHVSYTIEETDDSGLHNVLHEDQVNRYFLVQEMAGWLVGAGFEPLAWHAGFTDAAEIGADTWHVLAVARRVGAVEGD